MKRVLNNVWFIDCSSAFSTFPHLQNLEKEDQIQSVEAKCQDERVKDDVMSVMSPRNACFGTGNP